MTDDVKVALEAVKIAIKNTNEDGLCIISGLVLCDIRDHLTPTAPSEPVGTMGDLPSGAKFIKNIEDANEPYTRPKMDWWWLEFKLNEKRKIIAALTRPKVDVGALNNEFLDKFVKQAVDEDLQFGDGSFMFGNYLQSQGYLQAQGVDIETMQKEWCIEHYGHDEELYSLPFPDFALFKWLNKKGYLSHQPQPDQSAVREVFNICKHFDKLSLVIETSVRNTDPKFRDEIVQLIKKNREAIKAGSGDE